MKKSTIILLALIFGALFDLPAQQFSPAGNGQAAHPEKAKGVATPEISFDPAELIEIQLYYGMVTTRQLTVINNGTSDLQFSIGIQTDNANLPGEEPDLSLIPIKSIKSDGGQSPNVSKDDVIRWDDGANFSSIGLTQGGTYSYAAYFPASVMSQHAGMKLSQVETYIDDEPTSLTLKIFGQGTPTQPGALLHSQPVTAIPFAWNMISLSQILVVNGQDLWIGFTISHIGGKFCSGTDDGPAVAGYGDMLNVTGNQYFPMSQEYGLNYNWNIAGYLVPGQAFDYDAGIQQIISPSSGNHLTSEPVIISIKNFGTQTLTNIPWSVNWSGQGSGSFSGTYAGPLLAGQTAVVTAGTVNLTYGTYIFEACMSFPGDQYAANDCKSKVVVNSGPTLCINSLYTVGCSSNDGLTSWDLSNIKISEIPCTGSPGWYHNYTDQVHQMKAGTPYQLKVIAAKNNTWFDVWVDFDKSWSYSNDYELVLNDAVCNVAGTVYTFIIVIPPDVPEGEYFLRMRTNYNAPVHDPCATYIYGNCADFKVMVSDNYGYNWLSAAPLNGTIPPGGSQVIEVSFDSNEVPYPLTLNGNLVFYSNAPGSPHYLPATLMAEGMAPSIAVTPPFLNVTHYQPPEVTSHTFAITNNGGNYLSFEVDIEYFKSIANNNMADEPFSNSRSLIDIDRNKDLSGTLEAESAAGKGSGLCVDNLYTTGCSNGDGLTFWLLRNVNMPSIPCSGSPSWYNDYSDEIHFLEAGNSYLLQVAAGYNQTYFDVWIDLNNNLQLDEPGELVLDDAYCDIAGIVYFFQLNIPNNAMPGTYAMRARTNRMAEVTHPCNTYMYGNCMDFKVKIGDPNQQSWLLVQPTSGIIAAGQTAFITATLNSSGLMAETYMAALLFTSNDPQSPVVAVPVSLYPSGCNLPAPINVWMNSNWSAGSLSVDLTWEMPPSLDVIRWDNGENHDGFGLTSGGTFSVGARFTSQQLSAYTGLSLTHIGMFPRDPAAGYSMRVWLGAQGTQLVLDQPVSVIANQWNTFTLNTPIPVTGNQDIYIGYIVSHQGGTYPAGRDAGPVVSNFGDLIIMGYQSWVSMSVNWGTNFNWNIVGHLGYAPDGTILPEPIQLTHLSQPGLGEPVSGNLFIPENNKWVNEVSSIQGFLIKRNGVVIANIPIVFQYTDWLVPSSTFYCYSIGAVYNTCDAWSFEVCAIQSTNEYDQSPDLTIYPNPATGLITVTANGIREVTLITLTGQEVFSIKADGETLQINTSGLKKGIYMIKVETDAQTHIQKLIVQ